MPTTLSTRANDKSTYAITATFTDEDDVAVIPTTVSWSLSDDRGTIINARTLVSITPATSIEITLSGNDLKFSDGKWRVLTIQATYTSNLGTGLPLKDQVTFSIEDLIVI
jgi:hypothetical protein